MGAREIKTGCMPDNDFTYEEFEGLLGSFYLTFLCLKKGDDEDKAAFQKVTEILNGFAESHHVRIPKEATGDPQPTEEAWGQPGEIGSCFSVLDSMSSFWRDFGLAADHGKTEEGLKQMLLGQCILGIFHKHKVVIAEFKEYEGVMVPVNILERGPHMRQKFQGIFTRNQLIKKFYERVEKYSTYTRIKNSDVSADAPRYYYCDHCGQPDVKPEGSTDKINNPCKECKVLIETGFIPMETHNHPHG